MKAMIYRRRRQSGAPGGFYQFENLQRRSLCGFGDGEYVRIRDEYGNVWQGTAEREADNTIRYRFRDANGRCISGLSDHYGILLRDERGNIWRGTVD